jgi:hypothetical protein
MVPRPMPAAPCRYLAVVLSPNRSQCVIGT